MNVVNVALILLLNEIINRWMLLNVALIFLLYEIFKREILIIHVNKLNLFNLSTWAFRLSSGLFILNKKWEAEPIWFSLLGQLYLWVGSLFNCQYFNQIFFFNICSLWYLVKDNYLFFSKRLLEASSIGDLSICTHQLKLSQ